MKSEIINLWKEMADHTNKKCMETCQNPGQCCHTMYCEVAAEAMEKAGHEFTPLEPGKMFLENDRCTVPPHFRMLCSLQQCKISGMGADLKDQAWTKKYFDIKEVLEIALMEEESEAQEFVDVNTWAAIIKAFPDITFDGHEIHESSTVGNGGLHIHAKWNSNPCLIIVQEDVASWDGIDVQLRSSKKEA